MLNAKIDEHETLAHMKNKASEGASVAAAAAATAATAAANSVSGWFTWASGTKPAAAQPVAAQPVAYEESKEMSEVSMPAATSIYTPPFIREADNDDDGYAITPESNVTYTTPNAMADHNDDDGWGKQV